MCIDKFRSLVRIMMVLVVLNDLHHFQCFEKREILTVSEFDEIRRDN